MKKQELSLKGNWIYWRWKKSLSQTLAKDFVQDCNEDILELHDTEWHTQYPTRVLLKEIDIFKVEESE